MKQHRFRPRNFTAVGLSLTWLVISIFFISQGTFVLLWTVFAVLAAVLLGLAIWVLFADRSER